MKKKKNKKKKNYFQQYLDKYHTGGNIPPHTEPHKMPSNLPFYGQFAQNRNVETQANTDPWAMYNWNDEQNYESSANIPAKDDKITVPKNFSMEGLNELNSFGSNADKRMSQTPTTEVGIDEITAIGDSSASGAGGMGGGMGAMGGAMAGVTDNINQTFQFIETMKNLGQFSGRPGVYSENTGTKFALGGLTQNPTIEVEGEEVIETPDGQLLEAKGPSHEQGGIVTNDVPAGSMVYSDAVKKAGKSMAARKLGREKSWSAIAEKAMADPQNAILMQSMDRILEKNKLADEEDKKLMEAARQDDERKTSANNLLSKYLGLNEAVNQATSKLSANPTKYKNNKEYKKGGKVDYKYETGGEVGGPGDPPKNWKYFPKSDSMALYNYSNATRAENLASQGMVYDLSPSTGYDDGRPELPYGDKNQKPIGNMFNYNDNQKEWWLGSYTDDGKGIQDNRDYSLSNQMNYGTFNNVGGTGSTITHSKIAPEGFTSMRNPNWKKLIKEYGDADSIPDNLLPIDKDGIVRSEYFDMPIYGKPPEITEDELEYKFASSYVNPIITADGLTFGKEPDEKKEMVKTITDITPEKKNPTPKYSIVDLLDLNNQDSSKEARTELYAKYFPEENKKKEYRGTSEENTRMIERFNNPPTYEDYQGPIEEAPDDVDDIDPINAQQSNTIYKHNFSKTALAEFNKSGLTLEEFRNKRASTTSGRLGRDSYATEEYQHGGKVKGDPPPKSIPDDLIPDYAQIQIDNTQTILPSEYDINALMQQRNWETEKQAMLESEGYVRYPDKNSTVSGDSITFMMPGDTKLTQGLEYHRDLGTRGYMKAPKNLFEKGKYYKGKYEHGGKVKGKAKLKPGSIEETVSYNNKGLSLEVKAKQDYLKLLQEGKLKNPELDFSARYGNEMFDVSGNVNTDFKDTTGNLNARYGNGMFDISGNVNTNFKDETSGNINANIRPSDKFSAYGNINLSKDPSANLGVNWNPNDQLNLGANAEFTEEGVNTNLSGNYQLNPNTNIGANLNYGKTGDGNYELTGGANLNYTFDKNKATPDPRFAAKKYGGVVKYSHGGPVTPDMTTEEIQAHFGGVGETWEATTENENVRAMQQAILDTGYTGFKKTDAKYGPLTKKFWEKDANDKFINERYINQLNSNLGAYDAQKDLYGDSELFWQSKDPNTGKNIWATQKEIDDGFKMKQAEEVYDYKNIELAEEVIPELEPAEEVDLSTKEPYDFTQGDLTGMAGTMIGGLSPMMTTMMQQAATPKNTSFYETYMDRALGTMEGQKGFLGQQKSKALRDVTIASDTFDRKTRRDARSINTLRALGQVSNAQEQKMVADVYSKYAQQMMGLTGQIAQMQGQQDMMKMQGREKADLANRQDTDAFFTNMNADQRNLGTMLQKMGKDLNVKQSDVDFLSILPDLNKYGINMRKKKGGGYEMFDSKTGRTAKQSKLKELAKKIAADKAKAETNTGE